MGRRAVCLGVAGLLLQGRHLRDRAPCGTDAGTYGGSKSPVRLVPGTLPDNATSLPHAQRVATWA